ncbi:MAG: hypothetical protein ACFCBW_00360 [Candidatus Competibacterales bacterium]
MVTFIHNHGVAVGLTLVVVVGLYGFGKIVTVQARRRRERLEQKRRERRQQADSGQQRRLEAAREQVAKLEALRAETMRQREAHRRQLRYQDAVAAAEREAIDRALTDWARNEATQAQQSLRESESQERELERQLQAQIIAIDTELADWERTKDDPNERSYSGPSRPQPDPLQPSEREILRLRQRIDELGQETDTEANDLNYLLEKVQTGVDFLPVQVQYTIARWKMAEINRRSTFEDLKRKFRYQAYSIEDGLELYHLYEEWLERQRRRLYELVECLGTTPRREEPLLELLARAEAQEWHKGLDINMDIIAGLREIRRIHEVVTEMEYHLMDLATACRRRSTLVIEPEWEPKGIL